MGEVCLGAQYEEAVRGEKHFLEHKASPWVSACAVAFTELISSSF